MKFVLAALNDEQAKFLVVGYLSASRTTEDATKLCEKSVRVAKRKPVSIYCDGLPAYVDGYNKVFYTMKKEGRLELIRRVGIRNIHDQNAVERLHGTLKDRLKPTRGLKGMETVRTLLEGWVVHYNYMRKHPDYQNDSCSSFWNRRESRLALASERSDKV